MVDELGGSGRPEAILPLLEKIGPGPDQQPSELAQTIMALLGAPASPAQRKRAETLFNLAIESLSRALYNQEGFATQTATHQHAPSPSEARLVEELGVLGKLLERCYIYSTDIEYAQFYNKELALRVDGLLQEQQRSGGPGAPEGPSLHARVEQIFAELEARKQLYFRSAKQREQQGAVREDRPPKIPRYHRRRLSAGGGLRRLQN